MKKTDVKVIGINRDPKTGKVMTVMEVTLDGKKQIINVFVYPQCYGKWNEWAKTSSTQCRFCRFREFCKEDTIKKFVANYEMRKYEYERRQKREIY